MGYEKPGGGSEEETGNSRNDMDRRTAQAILPRKTLPDFDSSAGQCGVLVTCGVTRLAEGELRAKSGVASSNSREPAWLASWAEALAFAFAGQTLQTLLAACFGVRRHTSRRQEAQFHDGLYTFLP